MLKRFATIRTQFKAALRRANLPDIRFHDLRHSAATILLAMDVNIKVIQELLGHASITTTLGTYSHVTPSIQSQAMHLLDTTYHQFRQDAFNKAKNAQ